MMAVRINADGYFLDPNGKVSTTIDQSNHATWKQFIDQAWTQDHPNDKSGGPQNQTIMVVQPGDCQWTIALQAGADPALTAYGGNGTTYNAQFSNPDLIHPGDIEFVSPTTVYAVTPASSGTPASGGTPAIPGAPAHDNADIFANQTLADTAAEQSSGNYDPNNKADPVNQSVAGYVGSFPANPSLSYQALINTINGPDWGDREKMGNYGRQIILDDYFATINPADRAQQAQQLKTDLGLGTSTTSEGKTTYSDKTDLAPDQKNLLAEINSAAGIS
jgi:hypothetical protein